MVGNNFSFTDQDAMYGECTRLADWQIETLCGGDQPLISPFFQRFSEPGMLSHGLGPAGYDARLGYKFLVLKNPPQGPVPTLDPLNFNPDHWRQIALDLGETTFTLSPNACILAETMETFCIPSNISATVEGKSTYARVFFKNHMTPLEPGWNGVLTLEFTNLTSYNLKVYPGQGVCQIKFWRAPKSAKPYDGRYQDQTGVTPSRSF